jgi:hypothetical protein
VKVGGVTGSELTEPPGQDLEGVGGLSVTVNI